MTFADPRWLVALFAIPIWALLELWTARRSARAARALVGERQDHPLLAQVRPRARLAEGLLRTAAAALSIVGAARPEWGREVVQRGATGSDVAMVVDVSASMDARDVLPSRIDEARREALAVLERLGGSRVGVVAFAGDAVRLCPLTLDRSAARLTIESLASGSVSQPGSDLGRGLRMALRMLPPGRREEQAIVLWTDGEDLEGDGRAAVDEIASAGIRVFTVGVGTPAGDVVPVLDDQGRAVDVKRDESGNAVRSRLDEPLLRHTAQRTRGAFFSASRPGGELPRLLAALGTVAQTGRGNRLIERSVARFPWCAALAVLLLALERVHVRRRRRAAADGPGEVERPRRPAATTAARAAAAAATTAALLASGVAEAQSPWARGNQAFEKGRYAEAESLYSRRLGRSDIPAVRLNRALSRALGGDRERRVAALGELEQLADRSDRIGNEAGFDLGTMLGEAREYDRALAALRRTLERDPADQDARWNYEVLLQRREEERRQRQSQPDEPQPQPSQPSPQQQQPQPAPGAAPQPQTSPTGDQPRPSQGMSRQQAEQILDALQELQRMEQQRQRRVRVLQDRRGRDW